VTLSLFVDPVQGAAVMAGLLGVLPANPVRCPKLTQPYGPRVCPDCTDGVVAPRSLDGARTPLTTTDDLPGGEQIRLMREHSIPLPPLSSVVGSVVLTDPYPIVDTDGLSLYYEDRTDCLWINGDIRLFSKARGVEVLPGAAFLGDPEGLVGRWAYLATDPQPLTENEWLSDREYRMVPAAPFPVEHSHPPGTLADIEL
jgi:hypothetical protein